MTWDVFLRPPGGLLLNNTLKLRGHFMHAGPPQGLDYVICESVMEATEFEELSSIHQCSRWTFSNWVWWHDDRSNWKIMGNKHLKMPQHVGSTIYTKRMPWTCVFCMVLCNTSFWTRSLNAELRFCKKWASLATIVGYKVIPKPACAPKKFPNESCNLALLKYLD